MSLFVIHIHPQLQSSLMFPGVPDNDLRREYHVLLIMEKQSLWGSIVHIISEAGCKNRNIWITHTTHLIFSLFQSPVHQKWNKKITLEHFCSVNDGHDSDLGDVFQCETEVQVGLELPDDARELKGNKLADDLCEQLYHWQLNQDEVVLMINRPIMVHLRTWFKTMTTLVPLSSSLDWTTVWRTATTVGQQLRDQTAVVREVDLNSSELNFKLTHRWYDPLPAGQETTLLAVWEDLLLRGQTSPWFQSSTHKM